MISSLRPQFHPREFRVFLNPTGTMDYFGIKSTQRVKPEYNLSSFQISYKKVQYSCDVNEYFFPYKYCTPLSSPFEKSFILAPQYLRSLCAEFGVSRHTYRSFSRVL